MPLPLANALQWSDWVVPNGGIDESKSDHELPPNKWARALDVEPLPVGCRARNGKIQIGSAITANAITGILDYRKADGTTERLLIVCGTEVYKEVGGVFTMVSPGTGTFTNDPNVFPAMTVGDDKAFISNGIENPQRFYVDHGTDMWANDGIAAPVATPTAVASSGGTLEAGAWLIDYYYWDNVLGIKSNTRYQGAASARSVTVSGSQKITISGLPSAVQRAGDSASHLRISLKSPSGGIFRFAGTAEGQVALGTTTATITTDATTNEPDYDDDPAPIHKYAAVGANQRFLAGIAAFPYRVYASKINITGAFYESFPSLNYRDFGKGDGDYVTATAFIPPATLIVGMRNSVWALDARRFLTADPVLISKNVGIAGGNALMVVGRTLFFVSDSDRTKGMMVWNGSQVTPLTALDKTFKLLAPGRIRYASCAHLAPGDGRFQWWILLTSTGSTPDRVLCYDYALDAFTVYRHTGNIIAAAAKAGGIAKVKIGGTAGDLYDADTGVDDAGTPIVASLTARRNDYGAPDAPKRVRFIRAEGPGGTNASVNVTFEPDVQGFASFSGRLDFNTPDLPYWGTAVWGAFRWSAAAPIISTRAGLNGVCRNAQPTFSSGQRWGLNGWTLGVQTLRRRM